MSSQVIFSFDSTANKTGEVRINSSTPGRGYFIAKRCIDVIGSGIALLLLSPVFFITALAVRLESKGPVFFLQQRVGKDGKLFNCLKFRSMAIDADSRREKLESTNEMEGGVTFKMKNDPRITRVGKIIRSFSIDELPQLINVLKGDMTLVGPRPPIPSEVAQYTPLEMRRLEVKQGLTCIWQVSGRSDIPFEQQVALDIDYISKQSLWLDLKLMFLTVPAVISQKGAY